LQVEVLRKTPVSVIFQRLYFILSTMMQPKQAEQSAKATASLVTGGGLILVWAIIWTNIPPKDELVSAQSATPSVERSRPVELDLTIPGVHRQPVQGSTGTG
ncbi:MAG TPA: hypothetical protein DDY39_17305, partial [Nitrospira sp.]|nr:hypothetical protein [Nitrospira sp.]